MEFGSVLDRNLTKKIAINQSTTTRFHKMASVNAFPSDAEIIENPPSRSAKFRYAIKKNDFYNFDTDILEKFRYLIEIENYGEKL